MRSCDEIFVYVGPRARGEFAIERAARLASLSGARVTLAMRQTDPRVARPPGVLATSRMPPAVERLLEPLIDRGVDVVVRVLAGKRMSTLVAAIEEARPDLVIKAADFDDMRLAVWRRTRAERLAAACAVPVWLVRLAPPRGPAAIVAALGTGAHDDPVHDAHLLATARRISQELGASLHIVSHGLALSDNGPARRMGRTGDVRDDTLHAVSTLNADLVVISAEQQSSVLGRSAVRGILRGHHASVLMVPRRLSRESSSSLPPVPAAIPGAVETPS